MMKRIIEYLQPERRAARGTTGRSKREARPHETSHRGDLGIELFGWAVPADQWFVEARARPITEERVETREKGLIPEKCESLCRDLMTEQG